MFKRGWILPHYLDALRRSFDQEFDLVFVGSEHDEDSWEPIRRFSRVHRVNLHEVYSLEPDRDDNRYWSKERYHHMVYVRNLLLGRVRELEPDIFFSVDTDILLNLTVVNNMIESLSQFDAVAGKVYLSPTGTDITNAGHTNRFNNLIRVKSEGVLSVKYIMALKAMRPSAYNIDYEFHHKGEDLGWSNACRREGLKLGFDGRKAAMHVMEKWQLGAKDKRI